MGAVKLPEDFDYKQELGTALEENINNPDETYFHGYQCCY
jgi:hypothetical protein